MSNTVVPPTKDRGSLKLWRVLLLTALTLGSCIALAVSLTGGLDFSYVSPPTLSSSTARTQNGFTLTDVQRKQRDGTLNVHLATDDSDDRSFTGWIPTEGVLLIQVPDPPSVSDDPEPMNSRRLGYKCDVTTSTGSSYHLMPADANYISCVSSQVAGSTDAENSWCKLPDNIVAYDINFSGPTSWKYIDIKFSDKSGKSARRRLINLPHISYLILHPAVSDEHMMVDGLSIDTWSTDDFKDEGWGAVDTNIKLNSSAKYPVEYSMDLLKETYNVVPGTTYIDRSPSIDEYKWPDEGFAPGAQNRVFSPYADKYSSYSFSGVVKRQEVIDEVAVFHDAPVYIEADGPNIPHHFPTLVVRTPSGITVRYMQNFVGSEGNGEVTFNSLMQNDVSFPNNGLHDY